MKNLQPLSIIILEFKFSGLIDKLKFWNTLSIIILEFKLTDDELRPTIASL